MFFAFYREIWRDPSHRMRRRRARPPDEARAGVSPALGDAGKPPGCACATHPGGWNTVAYLGFCLTC